MAQGWSPKEQVVSGGLSVVAGQTNLPISREYPMSAGGARMCAVAITTGTTTGTVTAKLQTAMYGTEWEDRKTVTLTAGAGDVFYITLLDTLSTDQQYLPLFDKCRVVVTTAAVSTVAVTSVLELQER